MIEVITDNLTTLISDQISVITYYKLSSDRAKGELPVSILVGMIKVITNNLTTLIIDQISGITYYKMSSDRAKGELLVPILVVSSK